MPDTRYDLSYLSNDDIMITTSITFFNKQGFYDMRRYVILVFVLFNLVVAYAQHIQVKSFQPLPMDMTASSLEGKRIDQNS